MSAARFHSHVVWGTLFSFLLIVSSHAQEVVGAYQGDGVSMKIDATGNAVSGTLQFKGQEYPFSGTLSNGMIAGTFRAGSSAYEFSAKLDGERLTFVSGSSSYQLKKLSPQNPLDAGEGQSAVHANASDADPARDWKTFKHPTGLMLKYPPDWTTQEQTGFLQFVPPDPASNAQGPAEAYLVGATTADGITDVKDPRVSQYVETQLAQIAPFLKSTGKSESVRAVKTDGIVQTFEGTNPMGKPVKAQIYTTIIKGYAISMIALGETPILSKREAIARNIFMTITDTEAQIDPVLVGKWHYWTYSGSSDGKFSSEHDYHIALLADGTAVLRHRAQTAASISVKDGEGNETAHAGTAGDSTKGEKGKWSAGGGKIYLQWDDGGANAYEYSVSGTVGSRKIIAKAGAGAKPVEWNEE